MKNLLWVQNKSAHCFGRVTLAIRLLGKVNPETFKLFKTLIMKMACLTIKDIEAALNVCISVYDWETLTSAIISEVP